MDILSANNDVLLTEDPGFVDTANEKFEISDSTLTQKIGFQTIPFDSIGLYVDEYRTLKPKK